VIREAVKLFSSAKLCPNISEPHANKFGFEVNERIFKLAACKALVISDNVASLEEDIFTIETVFENFHDSIEETYVVLSRLIIESF